MIVNTDHEIRYHSEYPLTRIMELSSMISSELGSISSVAKAMARLGMRDVAQELYETCGHIDRMCELVCDNANQNEIVITKTMQTMQLCCRNIRMGGQIHI